MKRNKIIFLLFFSFCSLHGIAQKDSTLYFKGATKENRDKQYRGIINNSINKNFSLPLTDSTEANWEDAFDGIELLQYKSPWADSHVYAAFDSVEKRSADFQQALLTLVYANYPNEFKVPVSKLIQQTDSAKTVALCAEYLLETDTSRQMKDFIWGVVKNKSAIRGIDIEQVLFYSLIGCPKGSKNIGTEKVLASFFSKDYLPKNVVVFSIQRKKRDYPGIAIVRDTAGNFIKDENGSVFSVPQLARSMSNLPFYLTDGNTPQGIFRMDGFAVSRANYIGPTPNIQLMMPFETSVKHFVNDSTITDNVWTTDWYKKLLPDGLKDYLPLYETYAASQLGRTEIIAHGTTVDPDYYKGKIYYPQTPTLGCLCTKEIWSGVDGERLQSDQQKLDDAIKKAGGANGYYIVIEIDDQQKSVSLEEILPYIQN